MQEEIITMSGYLSLRLYEGNKNIGRHSQITQVKYIVCASVLLVALLLSLRAFILHTVLCLPGQ